MKLLTKVNHIKILFSTIPEILVQVGMSRLVGHALLTVDQIAERHIFLISFRWQLCSLYRRDSLIEKERRERGRFSTAFSQGKKFHLSSNVCWPDAWDLVKHMTITLLPISGPDLSLRDSLPLLLDTCQVRENPVTLRLQIHFSHDAKDFQTLTSLKSWNYINPEDMTRSSHLLFIVHVNNILLLLKFSSS